MDKEIYNSLLRIQCQGLEFNWFEPYKPISEGEGIGTGFFINSQGYILTCCHVIVNAFKVWVTIPKTGKNKYEAFTFCEAFIIFAKLLLFSESLKNNQINPRSWEKHPRTNRETWPKYCPNRRHMHDPSAQIVFRENNPES